MKKFKPLPRLFYSRFFVAALPSGKNRKWVNYSDRLTSPTTLLSHCGTKKGAAFCALAVPLLYHFLLF
ncbi:hypothetical protein [Lacticaseibacillus mingshuiensis]|uniref:Uncharacterized protein n=1 Tax=Lacticaseibacillus mingshuiensis TaxID=2799574 RepID=A0ABW4CLC5_9LACO|nr:hypothetical protein [Lacticaseibacillus mingshuiensis]